MSKIEIEVPGEIAEEFDNLPEKLQDKVKEKCMLFIKDALFGYNKKSEMEDE